MSKILDVGRGSYKEIIVGSGPYISIDGIDGADSGWLQVDFKFHLTEKNSIVQCFNEVNHVYAFGHDPENSSFSVTFVVFLGQDCMSREEFTAYPALDQFYMNYMLSRLSVKKDIVNITNPGFVALQGLLLSFDVSVYDDEMHAVTVTFSGKCVG